MNFAFQMVDFVLQMMNVAFQNDELNAKRPGRTDSFWRYGDDPIDEKVEPDVSSRRQGQNAGDKPRECAFRP